MEDYDLAYAWVGAKGSSADNFTWIVSQEPLPNNSPVWQSGWPSHDDVNWDCVYSYGYSNGSLANGGCGADNYICEKY